MQIAEGTVVAIDYALKDDEGTLLDQSQPGQPLTYLHGFRNIIPGLESQLEGKSTGDQLEVRVAPIDGYGEFNPMLEQVVPRERFEGMEGELQVGMQFQANTEQGPITVRVTKVEGEDVTVDGNHPLAGKHLNFSVTIADLREATEEEKAHGHLHGAGGGCCGGGGGEGGCCNDEPEAKQGECGEGSCGCSH
ncbi:peptidylprolyl isomerase [Coraliomargarita akajimensis]|uniref:Peptidyl-prolyl cis-trans isomerase n=1 Tax=Coraliomargarita akajimensis (strain DSM 45221 / IAM 15411 / JCM 23193 / KCTC 12865 / 04OKA010-24) TaxID=583355 RepID=D5EM29_CORAD|nr:peptidylprolyl isomerase [Coraliomargarita akajimensis]ADE55189.1 peptidylprolyl isomerase FKBP-type [Coraliomargarita akajimensis DSM 45221]